MDDEEERRADDLMRESKVRVRSRNLECCTRTAEVAWPSEDETGDELFGLLDESESASGRGGSGGGKAKCSGDGVDFAFTTASFSLELFFFSKRKVFSF